MTYKRILATAVVVAILGALVYFQFRTWQRFDWNTFATVTGELRHGRGLRHILIAIALIYFTYWLRAVRWKIFLKPVRRTSLSSLAPTQYIGFTGLALLGRLGELIRPYLIARKEKLTMSSQMAVWTVERIFDVGAFAVLMCINVFLFGSSLPHPAVLQKLGEILIFIVAAMAVGAFLIRRNGPAVADWMERRFSSLSPKFASSLSGKIRSFGEGLHTIHDGNSFLQLAGVSLLMWFVIALAYRFVLHAYPQPELRQMHVPQVLLLMASSMAGSMIQLPAVGGGSQLAVISMLSSAEWFAVPKELAVSAGMLLWLVTFMSVVPIGLAFAHFEHVSLRKLSEETEAAEVAETV
jgi:uncharacterized protein (TIRG00374 family)